jgi:hypothetical protein
LLLLWCCLIILYFYGIIIPNLLAKGGITDVKIEIREKPLTLLTPLTRPL